MGISTTAMSIFFREDTEKLEFILLNANHFRSFTLLRTVSHETIQPPTSNATSEQEP